MHDPHLRSIVALLSRRLLRLTPLPVRHPQARRAQLSQAFGRRWEPWPAGQQPASHWATLLQEAGWLAVDVSQVSRRRLTVRLAA